MTAGTPLGPPNAAEIPRFVGPDTFARLPRLDQVDHAGVAVLGVPFDAGVSYRSGARFGPHGIRAGSKLLRPYHPALDVNPWDVHQVVDAGEVRSAHRAAPVSRSTCSLRSIASASAVRSSDRVKT